MDDVSGFRIKTKCHWVLDMKSSGVLGICYGLNAIWIRRIRQITQGKMIDGPNARSGLLEMNQLLRVGNLLLG